MKKIFLTFIVALTLIFTSIPAFAQEAAGTMAEGTRFTDITGHWAEAAVNKFADPEVFAGRDGKFVPGKAITRIEFVRMLHKALDIKIKYFKEPDIKEFFDDVKNEDGGALALYDLVVANIIDHKGSFKPTEALPRDEMTHYIINALKSVTGGNYALIKMMPAPFADDGKITPAYKNDIVEAVLLKLVYGNEKNMFYPQNSCTRAEAAVVTGRLMNLLEKLNVNIEVKPSVEMENNHLKMKLTIANHSKEPVTINHSSGQKYDFTLLDSDRKVLYRWSADKLFSMALTTTVIDAGKTVEFTESLDEGVYSNIKDRIAYMQAYIIGESGSFTIHAEGYETAAK